jgi:hypothetical protein
VLADHRDLPCSVSSLRVNDAEDVAGASVVGERGHGVISALMV